jgi:nucleoid DNA-binding protein
LPFGFGGVGPQLANPVTSSTIFLARPLEKDDLRPIPRWWHPKLFKETPLAQTRGKTPPAIQPTVKTKPVKEALTKSALVNLIAEENGVTRDVAKGVLATIETAMMGSLHPRGVGEFTLPGLLKISLRKVPARRAGTLVRNPSTGEMVPGAAKPASMRVKIRPLAKLRTATAS